NKKAFTKRTILQKLLDTGEEHSPGHGLRDIHTLYAMYFNNRTALSMHVWQGRFYSCPLDDACVRAAVRYMERNPVIAVVVERTEDYRWSSAAAHFGVRSDALLSAKFPPQVSRRIGPCRQSEHEAPESYEIPHKAVCGYFRYACAVPRLCSQLMSFKQHEATFVFVQGFLQEDFPWKRV
ncbi:MAG TPA: hypothetical protein PLC40_11915, partial [Candidatus Hydrogenedentes bacterium]|nr:hypothetical protein [Candidatus Hydrogenedentota bacterium]